VGKSGKEEEGGDRPVGRGKGPRGSVFPNYLSLGLTHKTKRAGKVEGELTTGQMCQHIRFQLGNRAETVPGGYFQKLVCVASLRRDEMGAKTSGVQDFKRVLSARSAQRLTQARVFGSSSVPCPVGKNLGGGQSRTNGGQS